MKINSSSPFFRGKTERVHELGGGISRQFIAYDKDIMTVKVMFEQGAIGYQHSHPHTQTSYIVAGKFEVSISGEKQILETGDGFYAAPDAIHGVVCLEAGIILDTFNPIREDFYETIK